MKASKNLVSVSKQETLTSFYENINNVSDSERVMFNEMIDTQIEAFFKSVPLLKKYRLKNVEKARNNLAKSLVSFWLAVSFVVSVLIFQYFSFFLSLVFACVFVIALFVCLSEFETNLLSNMNFLKRLGFDKKDNSIKSQYVQLFMLKMLLNNKYAETVFDMHNPRLIKKEIFESAFKDLKSGSNIEAILNSFLEKMIIMKEIQDDYELEQKQKSTELELKRNQEYLDSQKSSFDLEKEMNEICEAKNIILRNISK